MTIERRVYPTQFRSVKGSDRQKWATAVTYDTVDDFGTIWLPGVFDKALGERMPTMLYGHDWENLSHVLGKGIDHRQTPTDLGPPGVDVLLEFDDPEFVPMVRQAMYQVDNKTLRDASVGFVREQWLRSGDLTQEQRSMGGKEAMEQAGMDELSLVVRGAVTGAHFRSRRGKGTVDLEAVLEIAKRKAAGELSDDEAKAAVDLLVGDGGDPEQPPTEMPPGDEPPPEDLTDDLDAALALIGRSGEEAMTYSFTTYRYLAGAGEGAISEMIDDAAGELTVDEEIGAVLAAAKRAVLAVAPALGPGVASYTVTIEGHLATRTTKANLWVGVDAVDYDE